MKEKDKLLNKLVKKDYNNLLEELLEAKQFDENVKSLILSMIYKIETAYKDYEKLKKNVLSKEEYMKSIFLTIQKKCEDIKLTKQSFNDNSKIKYIVDRTTQTIKCYPVETILLYCLSDIAKKDNILKYENLIINEALTKLLNEGNSINTCEPLRDFNGFSWNIIVKDIQNIVYNLIYQDLIILCGNSFLEEWINKNKFVINYMESFENKLEEEYGNTIRKQVNLDLIRIAILEEALKDESFKEKVEDEKIRQESRFNKFQNSSKYLVELGDEKKALNRKIKKLDQIINDKDLLNIEYERRNEELPLEKKIFSMRVLKKILQEERSELLKKTEELSFLMNPQVFLRKYEDVKQNMEYFKVLDGKNLKKDLLDYVINMQKSILEIFKIKIEEAEEKQQIIDLIYELRYYSQIPVTESKRICQVESLKEYLEEVENLLITKAINKKVITEISNFEDITLSLIRNIFDSKVISLESLQVKIYKEKENWKIQVFDDDILENTIEIEKFLDKKDLKVRTKKNIKLFI